MIPSVLALALLACSKEDTPPPAPAAPVSSAATAPTVEAAPQASAAPAPGQEQAAASLSAAVPEGAAPTASAAAAAAPSASGAALVAPTPSASAGTTPATPAGGGGAPQKVAALVPKAARGILAPGEADRLIKVGGSPVVRLLDPGAAPHATVAYAITPGKYPLGTRMDVNMAVSIGGQAMPSQPMPQLVIVMDVDVAAKDPAGLFPVVGTLRSMSSQAKGADQEEMAKAMQPQLQAFKGLSMSCKLSPSGQARDFALKMPPGVPAEAEQLMSGMSQSFESMVVPLPSEPVGTGARWQVLTRINSTGADIVQSSLFTLKSRTGDQLNLDVKLEQFAASATVNMPGMPPGASAQLLGFKSGGTGMSRIDLEHAVPLAARMSMTSGMDLGVGGGAAGQGGQAHIDMSLSNEIFRPEK
ncbi:hypothetical protein [Chondromyces crocatus]|uniref:hypothetical protein n=1 Tax=Chondromyces crocatus TaxID=52 RepID=UPI0012E168B2|nr:hypothetical protein [Chondromyces crocatus]